MLIDSHCHLDYRGLAERLPEVLARAAERGVGHMITISTRVREAETCRRLAEAHPQVMFSVGTHPHQAAEEPDVPAAEIAKLAAHPRCVAVGEAGLDFHYDYAPRDVQERVFRTHIEAARLSGLPLVIHAREADDVMIAVLREEMGRGAFDAVLHCFSSTEALARAGVELGLYVSFSGILTFKGSTEIRRIAAEIVPRDRLLVETDAPFLAPVPNRGRPNEPAFVADTAQILAETIGLSFEETARLTTENVLRLFRKARPLVEAPPAASAAA